VKPGGENSTWEEEGDLQEMYLSRKTFAFQRDNPGEMNQNRDRVRSAIENPADGDLPEPGFG